MARKSVYEDTNGVPRAAGKVLHVDVGDGDGTFSYCHIILMDLPKVITSAT